MQKQLIEGDRLFFIAENLAKDFSSFPDIKQEEQPVPGLLSRHDIEQLNDKLSALDIDAYIESVVAPAEAQGRKPAPAIIRQLGKVVEEDSLGPFYQAVLLMDFPGGEKRPIGFIAQDVHDAVPELANYAEDVDEWGVKYAQVTGLHNEAIKELAEQLNEKDKQIANLQAQIDELKNLILNK